MTSSNIAGTTTTYTYDTLGNLILEKTKNKVVDYQYNELNQLTKKKEGNESYSYTYDKRGNRTAEVGKKASRSYLYDETNRMAEGTNWKGDRSAYTYNGLGLRVNNTQTTHAGKVYTRDYVIDYTSFENDDLMVFAHGNGQLEYEQKHVYAGSERIEQFTDKGNWERTLYVHEDVMGNTRYYTKANGQSFAELAYDAWGMPESPNKLLNNDHGNYVFATFTGHIYDTTLDIYFAEARFYDANNRTWLAMDPIKDGGNWYQYCSSNPTTYYDPTGLEGFSPFSGCVDMNKLAEEMHSGFRDLKGKLAEFADNIDWGRVGAGALKAAGAAMVLAIGITAVVITGGAALPALAGLFAGTVSAGTAIVTLGTAAAGTAAFAFGTADMMEAFQDLRYGMWGSSKTSFNPLRDSMFTGNEDLYYELEMLATLTASAGTVTFRSFNMESEINASEIARYEKEFTLVKGNLTGSLNGLTTDEKKVVNDLLNSGKNVEIIPRSSEQGVKTSDFYVDGVKTELKTLNGTSLNTPVKRITEGFEQGASTVIIDGRKNGITMQEAEIAVNRAQGKLGNLPGTVEIWTNYGIFTR